MHLSLKHGLAWLPYVQLERFPCTEEGLGQRLVVGPGWPVGLSELRSEDRDS